MKVTILHTPADSAAPGLLLHLREILERGSIEVGSLVCSETGLPLPRYTGGGISAHADELRRELQTRFEQDSPDAVVLSDRLNGSKLVARRLAAQMGIGVLVLKESVFPSRVFFAPEGRPLFHTSEKNDPEAPLEEYQKFRLERALENAFSLTERGPSPLPPGNHGHGTGLVIIDHSTYDSDGGALERTWALVEEAKKAGERIILCERWRDVCTDHADCGRYIVVVENAMARRLPCRENQLRRLLRHCDWCATNGSLHALEALYLDKPVIVTDHCVYSGYGFSTDISSIDDCAQAILRLSQEPPMSGSQLEKFHKFLYRFLFNDLIAADAKKHRFAEDSEQRVLDALFRALPLETGARVLPGAAK